METEKTPRERAEDLIRLLVPDWRPPPQQVLWAIRIVLLSVLVLGILTLIGRPFDITLWQWLDLLIIPAVLAVGGFLFTRSENRSTQAASERRAQDEALQAYLDQVGQLLLDKDPPLRQSEEDSEVRTLARARTLTVLSRLDGVRKASVVRFLYESDLITEGRVVLALSEADLSGAYISGLHLRNVNLSEADLSGADLSSTRLYSTRLYETNLRKAKLNGADLHGLLSRNINLWHAQLSRANLSEAKLLGAVLNQANLSEANLHGANLMRAKLYSANLREADLSEADLSKAEGLSNTQLGSCMSLEGATMPDGQALKSDDNPHGPIFEDWLKSKGRGENDESSVS